MLRNVRGIFSLALYTVVVADAVVVGAAVGVVVFVATAILLVKN